MSCLPKFLLHELIGYECDEEGQEEVEKGHGEQEAGEVSAGRGGRVIRVISPGRSLPWKAPSHSHQTGTQSVGTLQSQLNCSQSQGATRSSYNVP